MTTTHDVPMPEPSFTVHWHPYICEYVINPGRPDGKPGYTADQVRDTAIKYADARCAKLQEERDALAEKVKALQDDARRYRWLRENWYYTVSDGPKDIDVGGGKTIFGCTETEVSGDEMDAAIDAAGGDQC